MTPESVQMIAQVLDITKNLTVTGTLVVFLVGAFRGWWVPGYLYKGKCDDLDRQTAIAETSLEIADRLTSQQQNQKQHGGR